MEGVQSAGSLLIDYPFETVSNWVVWGTTLRSLSASKWRIGQFEGCGWIVRGRHHPIRSRIQSLGVGGCHRIDSMQAARYEVDGGAGGPDR